MKKLVPTSSHTFRLSRNTFLALLLALLTTFPLLSAAAVPAGVKLADEQVIHRGNGAEPQSLDPHIAEGVPSSNIQRDLSEGLVSESPTAELVPGVAESWDISEDGLVYTFHLRKNAKWSNGDPVTAHDFVFSWERMVDPATASNYALMLAPIRNAEAIIRGELPSSELGVEALDDYTFRVNLKTKTPYFLGVLAHSTTYPVHRPSLEKFGDEFTRPGNLVTNGAYKLDDWVVQSHVKLVRNPQYWNDPNTTVNEVYYHATEDMNAMVLRYRAGELDISYNRLPVSQLDWVRENLGDELRVSPYLGIYYYGFNLTQSPFKNAPRALRKALSMAVDREIITDKVLNDGSIPAYGFVPPGVLDYGEGFEYDWKSMSREERLTEARRLYKEAGFREDNPLRLELRYNTEQNHKKIALSIAAMWKQNLGVITEIINQEWKVYLDVRSQRRLTQAFRMGWIGDYNDAYSFLELGLSYNGQNDSGYNNPDYDQLLTSSFNTSTPAERAAVMRQAEKTILQDYPIMPIYYYVTTQLIKPYVGGFESNIMDHHYTKHLYVKAH